MLNSCNLVIHTNANLHFKMPAVSSVLITDDIPFSHECSVSTEKWENYTTFISIISTYYSETQFCLKWHFLCHKWISQRGACRLRAVFVPKLNEMMLKCPLNFFEYVRMHLTTSFRTGKTVLSAHLTYVLPNLLN